MKKRVWLAKGYGSFQSAWSTLQGIDSAQLRCGLVRTSQQNRMRSSKLQQSPGQVFCCICDFLLKDAIPRNTCYMRLPCSTDGYAERPRLPFGVSR